MADTSAISSYSQQFALRHPPRVKKAQISDNFNVNKTSKRPKPWRLKDAGQKNSSRSQKTLVDALKQHGMRLCDGARLNAVGKGIHLLGRVPPSISASVTALYLSQNNLQSMEGVEQFSAVRLLSVGGNLISSDKEVERLDDLAQLRNLNLMGNPLCDQPNYRLRIIAMLTRLQVLDNCDISKKERDAAPNVAAQDDALRKMVTQNHFDIQKLQRIAQMIDLHKAFYGYVMAGIATGKFDCVPSPNDVACNVSLLLRLWRYEDVLSRQEREALQMQMLTIIIRTHSKLADHPKVKAKEYLLKLANGSSPRAQRQDGSSTDMKQRCASWEEAYSNVIALQQKTVANLNALCEKNRKEMAEFLKELLSMDPRKRTKLVGSRRVEKHVNDLETKPAPRQIPNRANSWAESRVAERQQYDPRSSQHQLPPQQQDPDTRDKEKIVAYPSFLPPPPPALMKQPTHLHFPRERKKNHEENRSREVPVRDRKANLRSGDFANKSLGEAIQSFKLRDSMVAPLHKPSATEFNYTQRRPSSVFTREDLSMTSISAISHAPSSPGRTSEGTYTPVDKSPLNSLTEPNLSNDRRLQELEQREEKYIRALMQSEQRELDLRNNLSGVQRKLASYQRTLAQQLHEREAIKEEVAQRTMAVATPKILKRFFIRWIQFYNWSQQIKHVQRKRCFILQHDRFWIWRRKVWLQQELRTCMKKQQLRIRKLHFFEWVNSTRVSVIAKRNQMLREIRFLAFVFRTWVNGATLVKREGKLLQEQQDRTIRNLHWACFREWKRMTRSKQALTKVQNLRWKDSLRINKQVNFWSWKLFLYSVARPIQERSSRLRHRVQCRQVHLHLREWRKLIKIDKLYNFRLRGRIWRRWVEWRHRLQNEKHAAHKELVAVVKGYFCAWHTAASEQAASRRSLNLAKRYVNRRRLRKLWMHWKYFSMAKRKYTQDSTKALKHYFIKLLRASWGTWKHKTHTNLLKAKANKHGTLQRHFDAFRTGIQLIRAQKARARMLAHAGKRQKWSLLRRIIVAWGRCTTSTKRSKQHAQVVSFQRNQRTIASFWRQWRSLYVVKLHNELKILRNTYNSTVHEKHELEAHLQAAKHTAVSLSDQIEILHERSKGDGQQVIELKRQIGVEKEKVVGAEKVNEDLRIEARKKEKAYHSEMTTTIDKQKELEREIAELRDRLKEQDMEREDTASRLQEYEKRIASTCEAMSEHEQAHERENNRLRNECAKSEGKWKEAQVKTAELSRLLQEKNQLILSMTQHTSYSEPTSPDQTSASSTQHNITPQFRSFPTAKAAKQPVRRSSHAGVMYQNGSNNVSDGLESSSELVARAEEVMIDKHTNKIHEDIRLLQERITKRLEQVPTYAQLPPRLFQRTRPMFLRAMESPISSCSSLSNDESDTTEMKQLVADRVRRPRLRRLQAQKQAVATAVSPAVTRLASRAQPASLKSRERENVALLVNSSKKKMVRKGNSGRAPADRAMAKAPDKKKVVKKQHSENVL